MGRFQNLIVYQKAFSLSMEIFKTSVTFPQEEKFGVTIQIRKSSRSVCACIAEGYRKRQYEAHFVAKMSDADMENSETQVWLDFALACNYITKEVYTDFYTKSEEIGKLLNHMIDNPNKYD